jgi:hypothetical protein
MRKVLSTSEIVQDLDREVEPKELCAAAEADYDDRTSTLVIKLDAFVRQVHHAGPDVVSRPDWLPKPETLREGVGPDDDGRRKSGNLRTPKGSVRPSETSNAAGEPP